MIYETMPNGQQIPALGFGTWQMGGGSTPDPSQDEELVAAMRRFIDMGYTHIDTAEGYGTTHTEELVGKAIKGYNRDDLFITTKVSPEHLRYDDVLRSCAGSLGRLGIDYVDLYLIHWPNPAIPLEDTFRALNQLVSEGKIKHVGVSNFDVPLMEQSVRLCETPLLTNQVRYNLLHREPVSNGVLAYCQEHDILLTAYSPLKDGVLRHPQVVEIARRHGVSPAQVGLRWLIDQPRVITIPKTSYVGHAQDNFASLKLELSAEDTAKLDAIG
jgi:diketogulonate reductase-like aldo/keto reductase